MNPNSALAFNNRGYVYALEGNYDRAIEDYDRALRLDPDSSLIWNNRGLAWHRKGQDDRAIQDFDRAIRLNPTGAGVANRASSYSAMGQYDRAIEDFDRALSLKPDDADLLGNRCYAKASAGALAAALADCNEALRRMPDELGNPRHPGLHLPEDAAVAPGARRLRCGAEDRSRGDVRPVRTRRRAPPDGGCEGRRRRHR